ncbi:unnamed protein product [Lathyrus sativus]|nr:unnamed protein product [Lathyrus sativus]
MSLLVKVAVKQKRKEKGEDPEVQQDNLILKHQEGSSVRGEKVTSHNMDVETVAESLGAVILSIEKVPQKAIVNKEGAQNRKWTRRKTTKEVKSGSGKTVKPKLVKRQLVDVMITEGPIEKGILGEKKRKQTATVSEGHNLLTEVVLDDQHRLPQ